VLPDVPTQGADRLTHQPNAADPETLAAANAHPDLPPTVDPEANPQATLDSVPDLADGSVELANPPPGWRITRSGTNDGSSRPSPEARTDRKVVAGYEILCELGRGSMGVVYKARQLGLNRLVALKMVLAGAHAGKSQLARFYIEAEAVAGLQHPNIVQIFEVGQHDELPYFSLEFVDGGSLALHLLGKPQPPKEAARLLESLARGMVCAHRQGIIHRDLKPGNVLLTRDGIPKITDFGLAKRLEDDSHQTKSGALLGTPSYMAPEQAAGKTKEVGPLADLYALGAILYEMLTGRPPLVGTTMAETLDLVQNKEPLPPSRLQPGVPRDLETICLKCLQKEPAKRYPTTEALADDLARFLAGDPIQARPVSRLERAWRWCKRNPRVAALASLALLLLATAGASLAALAFTRAHEQAAEAKRQDHNRKAIDETRQLARQRLELAAETVKTGDHKRALDQLHWSTPLLAAAPELADVRTEWRDLLSQVEVYGEFKNGLDGARFALLAGTRRLKQQAEQTCRQLIALDKQIRERTGRGSAGLPPLSAEEQQLFLEDVFETLLIAGLLETELARDANAAARQDAARRAIEWFNRADHVLPGMRVVYARRSECWGTLGDRDADKADFDRAVAIKPTSAVDRFWHGYTNHRRADEARRKGDLKTAEDWYRKEIAEYASLLQLRPDHFWGYFNWANSQFELGNLHNAMVGYTACVRLRPDSPWPYNNRGSAHLRLGENEAALQDYDKALALDAEYVEARANRGMAYFKLGKPGPARADLDRAVELNPDYSMAYEYRAEVRHAQKQYTQAVEDYHRLLKLTANKGQAYLKLAMVHNDMGRPDAAVEDCTQALAINPKNAQALYARAGFQAVRKEYLAAREDCSAVLALVPRALEPRRDRANLNLKYLKDFDASLADWEELMKLQPNSFEPYYGIGIIALGRRRFDEALTALRKAVELKQDHAGALWALTQIALWQGEPKEALDVINRLAENLPPAGAETLNIRGDVYRAMGRLDEAATDYRRLIALRPELPETYVSLAMVYEKLDRPDLAKECFEKLVAANSDSAQAYLRRAAFRRAHGEFGAALEDCARAQKKDPKSVLPGLVEASILAARGADGEAVAMAEPLLARAPSDGQVLYTAACVWSLASRAAASRPDKKEAAELAKRYTERAATLLQECLDKGFHDLLYPEHNRMAEDPALEPVRQHPWVSDLLTHRR
jgi:tetratricopeptide (TPR) repeat protein/tRNA A-37 threonylcarbamoyl transferase component Bud32